MKRIPISGKRGSGMFALVDNEDYEELSKFKWHLTFDGYAIRTLPKYSEGFSIRMHTQITGFDITDHRDRNVLNNQRHNLRSATISKNLMNSGKRKGCTSKYKGVSWRKRDNHYYAAIRIDGKSIHLGIFKKNEEHLAALAYNNAAKKLFGQWARLNVIKRKKK